MSYYVYVLTNKDNRVLYTGVTNDIKRRVYEHKYNINEGFTKRYNVHKLIYFEEYHDVDYAIRREKQIKSWSRKRKEELINAENPTWSEIGEWD